MVSLAEMSVEGSVDLQYRHTGLAWRLTSTAAKALELEPMQRHHCRNCRSDGTVTGSRSRCCKLSLVPNGTQHQRPRQDEQQQHFPV
jgi:hypothetical protein